jgi:hypothetical protein
MKYNIISAGLFWLLVLSGSASAASQATTAPWDRGHALAAAHSVDLEAAVVEIGNIASLGNARTTLEKLERLETRADWPMPAREAALFEFTRSLAELPRDAVAPEVMQHLDDYQVRTLVPDDDHGGTLVPLYDISAAAAGIENGWQRKEFAIEAIELLKADPARLVSAYLQAANSNQRSGYLDTLRQSDAARIARVQQVALAAFGQAPELTPVIGETAVATADMSAVRQLLIHGSGAALAPALRQLNQRLQPAELEGLLTFAVNQAPAVNASLAIAAWWPGLRHAAAVRDLLTEKLANPELGSAAALALASQPDVQTIHVLQQIATGGDVAARRARMALDMNREQLTGEALR